MNLIFALDPSYMILCCRVNLVRRLVRRNCLLVTISFIEGFDAIALVKPGIEANRNCSGVESTVGKDLFALANGLFKNPQCFKRLQWFCLLYANSG